MTAGSRSPDRPADLLAALAEGEIELRGRIPWSSNATFLVAVKPQGAVAAAGGGAAGGGAVGSGAPPGRRARPAAERPGKSRPLLAIYKPAKGERPLWDFPRGLWRREVAAYELDAHLGWELVPPTAVRSDGPLGPGSLQYCVDAVLDEHYFTLLEEPAHHRALRRIAAFDLVANNADRKGGHCLVDGEGHIWAIDNGLCFHVEPKLRTVVWDFAGDRIDDELLAAIERLARGEVPPALGRLLVEEEIAAVTARARALCRRGRYPEPATEYPYPWPLI